MKIEHSKPPNLRRRLFLFALTVGLVVYVFARIDWQVFAAALSALNYGSYLAFMLAFVIALLAADTFATAYIYRGIARVRFVDLFIVRAASYLPSILNHHAGQAWLTYFLSKVYRVPLQRVAGATLLSYVTWGGCILLLAMGSLVAAGFQVAWVGLPIAAGCAYLVLLWVKPERLARISFLAPLFEAGPVGHIRAMVLRLPHLVVLFLGTWLPFLFFGVEIPFQAALTYVPVIMVVVALPLTPVGLGTRDALAAEYLQDYVTAATQTDQRIAVLAASTACVAVTLTVLDAVIGLLFLRAATRLMDSAVIADGDANAIDAGASDVGETDASENAASESDADDPMSPADSA